MCICWDGSAGLYTKPEPFKRKHTFKEINQIDYSNRENKLNGKER